MRSEDSSADTETECDVANLGSTVDNGDECSSLARVGLGPNLLRHFTTDVRDTEAIGEVYRFVAHFWRLARIP